MDPGCIKKRKDRQTVLHRLPRASCNILSFPRVSFLTAYDASPFPNCLSTLPPRCPPLSPPLPSFAESFATATDRRHWRDHIPGSEEGLRFRGAQVRRSGSQPVLFPHLGSENARPCGTKVASRSSSTVAGEVKGGKGLFILSVWLEHSMHAFHAHIHLLCTWP